MRVRPFPSQAREHPPTHTTTPRLLACVERETAQASTPGMAWTARSTLPEQAAQDMPPTLRVNRWVMGGGVGWLGWMVGEGGRINGCGVCELLVMGAFESEKECGWISMHACMLVGSL